MINYDCWRIVLKKLPIEHLAKFCTLSRLMCLMAQDEIRQRMIIISSDNISQMLPNQRKVSLSEPYKNYKIDISSLTHLSIHISSDLNLTHRLQYLHITNISFNILNFTGSIPRKLVLSCLRSTGITLPSDANMETLEFKTCILSSILSINGYKSLRHLKLSFTPDVSKLTICENLETLNLSTCFHDIFDLSKFINLRKLILGRSPVTFSHIISLQHLTYIDVRKCKFTKDQLAILSEKILTVIKPANRGNKLSKRTHRFAEIESF